MKKSKRYQRIRLDSGQHRRIRIVAAVLGILAFVPVALRLYQLMVVDYDYYADLALRNQTRTTTVAADRGTIYDRNMNILAISMGVENVYLDPHELKQAKEDKAEVTDDCSAVENMGMSVKLVEGDEENIKITTPLDLEIAKLILEGKV